MRFTYERTVPSNVVWASALLAFFIDIRAVNWTLVYGNFGFSEGVMAILYPFSVLLMIVVFFFQRSLNKKIHLKDSSIFVIAYLLFFYYLTLNFIGSPNISFLMFAVTTICAFVIPQFLSVSVPHFLKFTMVFPFFAVFRIDQVFASTVDWDMRLSMDTSYAFLIPIIANIVYVFKYYKFESGKFSKYSTFFFSIINLYFFLKILQFGSRGPLLCIFLLLAWMYISETDWQNTRINARKFRAVILFLVLIIIGSIAFLTVLDNLFHSMDIQISSLTKIINLSRKGDISNGRENLADITLTYIYQKPFLGWGLDRFDANTGKLYPHNFILQILYDGGFLLFVLLITPLISSIKKIRRNCSLHNFAYLTLLFFSSVPGALFSQNLWAIPALWICYGAFLNSNIYKNKC